MTAITENDDIQIDPAVEVVIMDIDGTLANANHRLHLLPSDLCIQEAIASGDLTRNAAWKAFLHAAKDDTPNREIVVLSNAMAEQALIFVVTGRNERERAMTETWLKDAGIHFDRLYMRDEDDHRPDTEVKLEILQMIRAGNFEVLFAVEDRASVTKMWRDQGLRCLQVCEGNY